jgi:hypothetical protein
MREVLSRDELGLDFPDVETACLRTYCAACAIGTELAACGRSPWDYTILVMNAADEVVFRLPFSEALEHRPRSPFRRFLH